MTWELIWGGVGAASFGTLLGAWLGSRLTYGFQKELLDQQLEFQREQAELDATLRKEQQKELVAMLNDLRLEIKHRTGELASTLKG